MKLGNATNCAEGEKMEGNKNANINHPVSRINSLRPFQSDLTPFHRQGYCLYFGMPTGSKKQKKWKDKEEQQ